MEQDNLNKKNEPVFSLRLRAGRRRTYFFDVRPTRSEDYYLTITESKKRYNEDGYDRHKIFLYKEDFNKFIDAMNKTVDHIKTDLLPEYDFDEFTREIGEEYIRKAGDPPPVPYERKSTETETTESESTETESSETESIETESTESDAVDESTEIEASSDTESETSEESVSSEEETIEDDANADNGETETQNNDEEEAMKWD